MTAQPFRRAGRRNGNDRSLNQLDPEQEVAADYRRWFSQLKAVRQTHAWQMAKQLRGFNP